MNSCVFIILALFAVALTVDADCEVGWYTYRNRCYYFSMDAKSVENAKSYCQSIGGYLARIESKEENEYLKGIAVSRRSGDIWFDLTDSVKEGHWIYSANGKSTQFTDWNKGEPNAGKTGNCAGLYKKFGYKWDDNDCGTARYYICEKRSKRYCDRCLMMLIYSKPKPFCLCQGGRWKLGYLNPTFCKRPDKLSYTRICPCFETL